VRPHYAVTQRKTLFITGASRGIGRAIALRAAADGANIAIASKTDEPKPKLPGASPKPRGRGRRGELRVMIAI